MVENILQHKEVRLGCGKCRAGLEENSFDFFTRFLQIVQHFHQPALGLVPGAQVR